MTKDNIMKLSDGLFHRVFDEVAAEYPDVTTEHYIIDIGMARLAAQPERFDTIVLPNLYGDIISDVAAEVCSSVGMAGSANIGDSFSMFEAIHGSAPDIAGRGIANPSGLLHGALMMLAHIGKGDVAEAVHNAWLRTLEDGIHTADIYREERSTRNVSTRGFANAVIERLGKKPEQLPPAAYPREAIKPASYQPAPPANKELVGVDVFMHWQGKAGDLAALLKKAEAQDATLGSITNRGVKVWPDGTAETFCTDHWCCRFQFKAGADNGTVVALLGRLHERGATFIKTEHLYNFDGKPGYSLGQGE